MSLSLLEAASYGNCCLISDIPENTEVMGDNCVKFKSGDVQDLTDKLKRLVSDAEAASSLGVSTREDICDRYSWDKMTDMTEKVYSKAKEK